MKQDWQGGGGKAPEVHSNGMPSVKEESTCSGWGMLLVTAVGRAKLALLLNRAGASAARAPCRLACRAGVRSPTVGAAYTVGIRSVELWDRPTYTQCCSGETPPANFVVSFTCPVWGSVHPRAMMAAFMKGRCPRFCLTATQLPRISLCRSLQVMLTHVLKPFRCRQAFCRCFMTDLQLWEGFASRIRKCCGDANCEVWPLRTTSGSHCLLEHFAQKLACRGMKGKGKGKNPNRGKGHTLPRVLTSARRAISGTHWADGQGQVCGAATLLQILRNLTVN